MLNPTVWPASHFLDVNGRPRANVIDLGMSHYALGHTRYYADPEDGGPPTDAPQRTVIVGYNILHPHGPNPNDGAYRDADGWCDGGITLDMPEAEGLGGARWTLVSYEPLHVDPSILCGCGDHGHIHGGAWVPA